MGMLDCVMTFIEGHHLKVKVASYAYIKIISDCNFLTIEHQRLIVCTMVHFNRVHVSMICQDVFSFI